MKAVMGSSRLITRSAFVTPATFLRLNGLPDGTRLTRGACVTRAGKVWCRVFLTDQPNISAEYLAHR